MKFGLIIATKYLDGYNSIPAAGIGYIAGMLKKELPTIEIIIDQNIDSLLEKKPDIIGISSVTENYYIATDLAIKIKEKLKIPIILGGIHITLLPLSIKSCFDLAILGEGEYTIIEVLKSFINNDNTLNFKELEKIKGLLFVENDKIIITKERDLVEDLDSLPTLPYNELPFYTENGVSCIVSSRGCPFKCNFCASEKMFRKYRSFSVERIMKDVRYFINSGKNHIVFFDDLLIADIKKFKNLVQAIETEGINKICRFSCQVRANCITPEVCELLKRMNVVDAGIGIESFSNKMLEFYNKTAVTAAINQKAIDLLHEYKILLNPSIIFGASIETEEDMLITLRKIFENVRDGKIHSPAWGLFRPYPGTKIWDLAEKKGLVGIDMDFSKFQDWANFELYLCESVSKDDFNIIMRKWSTRITLMYHKRGILNPGNNFTIKDKAILFNNIEWLAKIIKENDKFPLELGDDLVLEAANKLI